MSERCPILPQSQTTNTKVNEMIKLIEVTVRTYAAIAAAEAGHAPAQFFAPLSRAVFLTTAVAAILTRVPSAFLRQLRVIFSC